MTLVATVLQFTTVLQRVLSYISPNLLRFTTSYDDNDIETNVDIMCDSEV